MILIREFSVVSTHTQLNRFLVLRGGTGASVASSVSSVGERAEAEVAVEQAWAELAAVEREQEAARSERARVERQLEQVRLRGAQLEQVSTR